MPCLVDNIALTVSFVLVVLICFRFCVLNECECVVCYFRKMSPEHPFRGNRVEHTEHIHTHAKVRCEKAIYFNCKFGAQTAFAVLRLLGFSGRLVSREHLVLKTMAKAFANNVIKY